MFRNLACILLLAGVCNPLLTAVRCFSAPAPPAVDWATLAIIDCNELPLADRSLAQTEVQSDSLTLVDGKFGKCVDFSQGGTASFALKAAAEPRDTVTIECWVNMQNTSAERLQRIVGRSSNLGFYVSGKSTNLTFFVFAREWKSIRADLPMKTWCHLAGTFDGQVMRLYVDGKLAGEVENPGALKPSKGTFFLGTEAGRDEHRFQGLIDEVRISKVVRTEFMTGTPLPRPDPTVALEPATIGKEAFLRTMAVPRIDKAPTLDGIPNEPFWQRIPAHSFVLLQTADTPQIPTSVKAAYDDDALYIAYSCIEKGQESFLAGPPERDSMQVFKHDGVEALLQPGGPGTPYVQLAMNPQGGLFDARYPRPGAMEKWDGPGIAAAGDVGPDMWTIELKVPFEALNVPVPDAGTTWRANFCRNELPSRELSAWAPTAGSFHIPGKFGLLQFGAAPAAADPKHTTGTHELRGTVVDSDGKPVEAIPVRTMNGVTRTDVFGEFTLAELPANTVTLQIDSPRYRSVTGTVQIVRPVEILAPITVERVDPYTPARPVSVDGTTPIVWLPSSIVEPPDMENPPAQTADSLSLLATPGEYESRAVAFYANRDLAAPATAIANLAGPAGVIESPDIDVRWTQRLLKRVQYKRPREDAVFSWRFLWREPPETVSRGQLRQLVVTVHVPDTAVAGNYSGTLMLSDGNKPVASLPVSLRVASFTLTKPDKRVGAYYGIRGTSTEQMHTELKDIKEHGGDLLIWHAGIWYNKEDDGTITYNTDAVREAVTLQMEHGIGPPYLVGTNPRRAAALAGLKVAMTPEFAEQVRNSTAFRDIYGTGIRKLDALEKELGAGEFLYTWMDEVFGRGRFEPWKTFSIVTREFTDHRIYITFHNRNQELVDAAAPYVDVRCYHGHTLDWWLGEGHTWQELADELQADGDEAWTYYNIREIAVTSEWVRLCNGYWLWKSPLTAHVPWKYYSFGGNPFDDLDSDRHDFAYAAPHPDKPEMVSSLEWECFREGYDDLRYLATLENAIRANPKRPEAPQAKALLKAWREADPRVPQTAEALSAEDYAQRRQQMTTLIEALSAPQR